MKELLVCVVDYCCCLQVKEEIKKVEEVKFEDVPDLSDFDIQKMKT